MAKNFLQNHLALIIDKISIVSLKLLLTINMCLSQIKSKIDNDTAILNNLALIIVMGDFYQFYPLIERLL